MESHHRHPQHLASFALFARPGLALPGSTMPRLPVVLFSVSSLLCVDVCWRTAPTTESRLADDRRQRDSHMTRCPWVCPWWTSYPMCTAPRLHRLCWSCPWAFVPTCHFCPAFDHSHDTVYLYIMLLPRPPSSSFLFPLLTNQHSFFGFNFLAFATFVLFSLLHSFRCSSVNSPTLFI